MYYLKVAHVEDEDADYFRFVNFELAAKYIKNEDIFNYVLSDFNDGEMLEDDYTLITEVR